jgi:nucleotide-binding universal stress UspA family protein
MNILVAYDGTNVAKAAVKLSMERAEKLNARVYLVTSMVGGPGVSREEFERAERELDYQKARFQDRKIPCETVLSVRGLEAGEDLVDFAKEKEVEEMIIGVKRRSKVGKLIFGSTAQYVIINAPCPVVSVK